MTGPPEGAGESLADVATFLSSVEAFRTLSSDRLSEVAASVTHRRVPAGEAMIVEGGLPGKQLFVLRDGTLDLVHRDALVTVMTSGELLGYPSLLTGTAPAFTVRARTDCDLYCIPGDLGVELLSREDGVRWLAASQRPGQRHRHEHPETPRPREPPGGAPRGRGCTVALPADALARSQEDFS